MQTTVQDRAGRQAEFGPSYRLVSVIAEGGMGVIYEVEHVVLGERRALKTLRSELHLQPDAVARIRREWQVLSSVSDPRVVRVLDAGHTAAFVPYFVMEKVPGITLRQALREGSLEPRARLAIALELLDVLQTLHAAGWVHRDIKPGNVMCLPDGSIKLLDFGLVKSLRDHDQELTRTGVRLGTPRYMAKEQIEGVVVDAMVDYYALGVVFHELFTGRHPFASAKTPDQMLRFHQRRRPKPPSDLEPELAELILGLMVKSPRRRRAFAGRAREVLERQAERANCLARGAETSQGTPRHLPERAALALFFAILMVASIVSATITELCMHKKADGFHRRPFVASLERGASASAQP